MTKLTGQQVADAGLAGWVNLLGGLQTRITTSDFATGLALVDAIGAAAEQMDHHPDLDLRYGHLGVRLTSHDTGGHRRPGHPAGPSHLRPRRRRQPGARRRTPLQG